MTQKNPLAYSSAGSLDVWHRRLRHLNINGVRNLANELVTGVKIIEGDMSDCKACPMGKHCRHPFGKKGTRAKGIIDQVHSDICGPMEVVSRKKPILHRFDR